MNDKIDLEDAITSVWAVKEDIDLFLWRYADHPNVMTEDEVWNMVAGISNILDLRCEKLWDTYCKKFELDAYATPEALAYRAKFLKGIREAAEKAAKAEKKAKKK
jgi:steroid 5-alpha reductase family enzyme